MKETFERKGRKKHLKEKDERNIRKKRMKETLERKGLKKRLTEKD